MAQVFEISKGRDFPTKSYLSQEERDRIFAHMGMDGVCIAEAEAASDAGDSDLFWEWISFVEQPTGNLLFFKKKYGAQFIRDKQLNTKRADEELGPGWLDR